MTDEDFDWHIENRLCVECDKPLGLDDTNPPKTVRHGVCAREILAKYLEENFGKGNVTYLGMQDKLP